MAQIFEFCGNRFQIYKRAHSTCDTVSPIRGGWLDDAAYLNICCDGSAHDGCQAGYLISRKDAWLKLMAGNSPPTLESTYPSQGIPMISRPHAESPTRADRTPIHAYPQLTEKV